MAHYLDTSVVVSLLLQDFHSLRANAWLNDESQVLLVSDFCAAEFLAVVSRQTRMRALTHDDASRTLDMFDRWRLNDVQTVPCKPEHMATAQQYIRDFATKLNAPDAIHMAITHHFGATLVTFDDRLAKAARRRAVAVVVPQ